MSDFGSVNLFEILDRFEPWLQALLNGIGCEGDVATLFFDTSLYFA